MARSGKDVIGLEYGSEKEVRHPIFPPQFSADSHHVAWVMAEAPGHIKMLVDGKGSQTFRAQASQCLAMMVVNRFFGHVSREKACLPKRH